MQHSADEALLLFVWNSPIKGQRELPRVHRLILDSQALWKAWVEVWHLR